MATASRGEQSATSIEALTLKGDLQRSFGSQAGPHRVSGTCRSRSASQ